MILMYLCHFKRNNSWCFSGLVTVLLLTGNATSVYPVSPERNLGNHPRGPCLLYVGQVCWYNLILISQIRFLIFICIGTIPAHAKIIFCLDNNKHIPKLGPPIPWCYLISAGLGLKSSSGVNPSNTFRIPPKRPPSGLWGLCNLDQLPLASYLAPHCLSLYALATVDVFQFHQLVTLPDSKPVHMLFPQPKRLTHLSFHLA